MTPADIRLVRGRFAQLAPRAPQAAAMFYDRVFERAPAVAALFRGDMAVQGRHLMGMLAATVAGLDDLPALERMLASLGSRHVGYGVEASHYACVGGALIDTLAATLGADFTPAHRKAWAAFYAHLAGAMQAATPAPAAAPAGCTLAA